MICQQGKNLKKNAVKGISLIEMLVVISVISILSVVGIPAYQRYLSSRILIGQATDFASFLRKAQQMTVTEQQVIKVEIPNNQQYRLVKILRKNENETEYELLEEKSLEGGVFLTSPCQEILFNFAGAPSCWGEFLFENPNQSQKVIMNAAGFIYIQ